MNEVTQMVKNIWTIVWYEGKRYLFSIRTLVLISISLLPTLFYIGFVGKNAAMELLLHELRYEWFVGYILITFVMFAYTINCAIVIITVQELIVKETALEILLTTAKRFELFIGKFIVAFIVVLCTSFFTFIGCFIALHSWNIALPIRINDLISAFLVLQFVSCVPLTITMLSNTLELKVGSISGISNGIPIFFFFVMPFFIFSTFLLGFPSEELLFVFSIFFKIYQLANFHLLPEEEQQLALPFLNKAEQENLQAQMLQEIQDIQILFIMIIVVSLIASWILFKYSDAQTKKE